MTLSHSTIAVSAMARSRLLASPSVPRSLLASSRRCSPASHQQQRRAFASADSGGKTKGGGSSAPYWLVGTLGLGLVGVIGYTLNKFMKLFKVWPKEMRKDLRAAVQAERNQDWPLAEKAYLAALRIAPTLATPLPLLHLTGIEISLAHLYLTKLSSPSKAYDHLKTALAQLDSASLAPTSNGDSERLTDKEKYRRFAILCKLGEIAERLGNTAEEEKFLTKAVEAGLRAVVGERRKLKERLEGKPQNAAEAEKKEAVVVPGEEEELPMPTWLGKVDIAAAVESLGNFYVREDKADYAAPLLLYAINTIVPPNMDPLPSTEDACRGAMIQNNLSNTLTLRPTLPNIAIARTWANRALETVSSATEHNAPLFTAAVDPATGEEWSEEQKRTRTMCEQVRAVALFNNGVLAEMANEYPEAERFLSEASAEAHAIGFTAGAREADQALQRVRLGTSSEAAVSKEKKNGGSLWKKFW